MLPSKRGKDFQKSIPEPVSGAADCFDARAGRAQLAPYLQDVLVERAAGGKVVLAPDGVQKRIAREYLPGMCGESFEKPKLSDGQSLFGLSRDMQEKPVRVNESVAILLRE